MQIKRVQHKTPSFKSVYNSKILIKSLKFAADNGALFSATTSLALSTIARPLAILATPKTDKENKKYACAKSFASSTVGYMIMFCASMPVAKAIKKIDKNPYKYLKQQTIKSLQENSNTLLKSTKYNTATQLFKLGLGLIIAIPKSTLTCALIPSIMKVLSPEKKEQHKTTLQIKQSKNKPISFKGLYNNSTDIMAKLFGKILDTKLIQTIAEKIKNTNYQQHIITTTDIILTGAFINKTKKSKKIKEENKKPLIYNAGISTGLCVTGGYAINKLTEKQTEKFIEKFKTANKNLQDLEKCIEGIKIAKPILILGGIYYILIPIISTFTADRINYKSS